MDDVLGFEVLVRIEKACVFVMVVVVPIARSATRLNGESISFIMFLVSNSDTLDEHVMCLPFCKHTHKHTFE